MSLASEGIQSEFPFARGEKREGRGGNRDETPFSDDFRLQF